MKHLVKSGYFLLGWLFFTTGLVGAFLPVLPTTPFMILALWMFAKSSQHFHDWLYHHRLFGPSLQQWTQHRVIPVKAKIASVSMMSISFIYMLIYSPVDWWMDILIGLFMLYGAWFVLSKPSHPQQNQKTAEADKHYDAANLKNI